MALALFDLDNTLIAGDSDHSWGEFLLAKGLVDAENFRRQNDYFYECYQNASLDIDEYLRFALGPLAGDSADYWAGIHRQFMQEVIAPMRLPAAEALLDEHRQRGDHCVIITATNGFITRPIAEALGADDIIATDPEVVGGRYTGAYRGTPCFGPGKVTKLEQWLSDRPHQLEGSYFYSDSINDLPLLEQVDYPVVVNPDERLAATARERGWPELDLRGEP